MSEPALQVVGVTKRYGEFTAVDGLSFEVARGAIHGFLGPNGAGKTTTIRMALDIIRPTSGEFRILGETSFPKVRHRVGYLPEEKGLYKKMTAWAVIAYFAMLKGLSRRAARDRAFELLEKYGLKDFAEARTEALSKGMGQKVQVLASIAHRPELVILDEPFSGLDPVNQQVLEEVIRELVAGGGTVLFSTHVMQHAERLCDRIVLMARGRKVFDGTIPEARRKLPRRVEIETAHDLEGMRGCAGVTALRAAGEGKSGARRWEIELQEQSDPQILLQHCFERGIRLQSFGQTEPTLHDVFVQLVGAEAREAAFR